MDKQRISYTNSRGTRSFAYVDPDSYGIFVALCDGLASVYRRLDALENPCLAEAVNRLRALNLCGVGISIPNEEAVSALTALFDSLGLENFSSRLMTAKSAQKQIERLADLEAENKRLANDLNDLRTKVRALAADCDGSKAPGLSPVLDMLRGLSLADFTPPKKPPVARSPEDVVPGWIYTDPMGDPMYVAQPRTYRWLTCPETDFYDLYTDYPEAWPLIPVCFVGCGRTYAEARGVYERAR